MKAEEKIKEVMELVNLLAHEASYMGAHGNAGYVDEADKNWREVKRMASAIETKLHELIKDDE